MKHCLSLFAVLAVFGSSLFCGVFGSTWIMDVAEDPDHPGQCYDEITGDYHRRDETWRRPNTCEGLTCQTGRTRGLMTITGATCLYYADLPFNCYMSPERAGVAYPACCPRVKCDGEPNGPFFKIG